MTCSLCRVRTTLFVFASMIDLALTTWLLWHSGRDIEEANPIAAWVITRYGWPGLALFKVGMVSFILWLVGRISLQRPRYADRILVLASLLLGMVIVHGLVLGRLTAHESQADWTLQYEEFQRPFDGVHDRTISYWHVVDQTFVDLVERKTTLVQAAARLARNAKNQSLKQQRILRTVFPGRSVEECLALQLLSLARDERLSNREIQLLEGQFESAFGCTSDALYRIHSAKAVPPVSMLPLREVAAVLPLAPR